jgi:hypothetical protein
LFFYSSDRHEPLHIHVEHAGRTAKVWLSPVRLESSHGFTRTELAEVVGIVTEHQAKLIGSWNDFFSDEE